MLAVDRLKFRSLIGLAAAGIAASSLGACAIHPLPRDVTGHSTTAIVRKIRCEGRSAVKQIAIDAIQRSNTDSVTKKETIDFLDKNVKRWKEIKLDRLDRDTRDLILKYQNARVAYDFTFTITEENKASGGLSLTAVGGGINGLSFKANNDRERQSIRNFRVEDAFGDVLVDDLTCRRYERGENLVYPIIGDIGLYEIFHTFTDLNEGEKLELVDKNKVSLFSDTLKFTTTFAGGANPTITLSPVGRSLSLANAGINVEAKRTDIHQVVVGLYLPAADEAKSARGVARGALPSSRSSDAPRSPRRILNDYLDEQIDRNILRELGTQRAPTFSLFP